MASSKKQPSKLADHVEQFLVKRVRPGQHLVLGLSGGVDSVVLLDLLVQLQTPLQFRLSAIHVNHQLSPHAADWAAFCASLCQTRCVQLEIVPVTVARFSGDSLEAAARAARHEALSRSSADHIILAHHLDDQAETLLLQLLRGCGVEGASAMAEENRRLLRPLLDISRSALIEYASQHDLDWVEDESNQDTRFDRNFLRHSLLPILEQRFPAYRETLSRASRNFAESARLQQELARQDAAGAIREGRLSIHAITSLSVHRAKNLLRYFLKQQGIAAPSAVRLEEMLRQLVSAKRDAQVSIPLGIFELRRFLGQAWIIPSADPPRLDSRCSWQGEEEVALAEFGGVLRFCSVSGQGISRARLLQEKVSIRIRQGGERMQPDCMRPRRSLKHLLQESGVPPWERRKIPLLFSGENLVAAIGLGVDCAYQARLDEPGMLMEWDAATGLINH